MVDGVNIFGKLQKEEIKNAAVFAVSVENVSVFAIAGVTICSPS